MWNTGRRFPIHLQEFAWVMLLVIFTRSARAQQMDTLRMELGIVGFYGLSSITFHPYQEGKSRPSHSLALSYRLRKNKYLGMQLELQYSYTGYQTIEYRPRRPYLESWNGQLLKCSDTWISVPTLLNIEYTYYHIRFHALVGGSVNFLIREKVGPPGAATVQRLYPALYHLTSLGICAGISIGYCTRYGNFYLEYRTNYWLTSIYRRPRIPAQPEPRSNVRNQLLGVSYYYPIQIIKAR